VECAASGTPLRVFVMRADTHHNCHFLRSLAFFACLRMTTSLVVRAPLRPALPTRMPEVLACASDSVNSDGANTDGANDDGAKTDGGAVTEAAKLDDGSFYAGFGAAAGLFANPVVFVSLYNVASTGQGLPAGPYDILGTLEGVSFLIVTAIVGVSALRKATTGTGFEGGPFGLLGLSEGLSFLSFLCALLIFPLRELGVVGNPKTALIDVPAQAEALRAFVAPLLASAAAYLSDTVQTGLGGDLAMPALPSITFPDGLALPALPEGLTVPELPTSLPSLPDGAGFLPSELPSLEGLQSKLQSTLSSLPNVPEGLPSLPSMPSSLPQQSIEQ